MREEVNVFSSQCNHRDIPLAKAVSGAFQPAVPSLDKERNLHSLGEEDQMESGLPRYVCTSAHIGGQVLTLEGQTCSLRRAFTTFSSQSLAGYLAEARQDI